MRKACCLILFFASALVVRAQQPTFQERAYRLDSKFKFMCTSDTDRQGNVILSGLIRPGSPDLHNSMILLVKPNTDTLWTRRGPDVPDYATYNGVKFKTDGTYAFATTRKKATPPSDQYDAVLQQFSPSGSLLLNHISNPNSNDNGINSYITLPDKGYLFNGSEIMGSSFFKLILTRTDSAGNVLWQRNHSSFAPNGLVYMEHAGNGGAIIAGGHNSGALGSPSKVKLLLTDASGNQVATNTLNLTDPTRNEGMVYLPPIEQCLVKLLNGGYLITGTVDTTNTSAGINSKLGFVAKVDANLQLVWKYIHRQPPVLPNSAYFTKANELKDGSIMVLGQNMALRNSNTPNNGFELYRLSAIGKLLASYPFTSNLYPSLYLNTLEALPDSSFIIGGQCRTAGNAQTGFYIAKVKIPNLPAGRPSVIMANEKELAGANTNLGQSYPNPTASEAIIPYNLPKNYRQASLIIREIATGREIRSYNLKPGSNSLKADVGNLSNGLYLYTLVIDDKPIATKKLAVMK